MPLPARFVLSMGLLVLLLTLVNAGTAQAISPELQRAEVIGGLAAVGLMLIAVLWTRANPRSAERQELPGEQGLILAEELDDAVRQELGWGSHMLLTATSAATVLVYWRGRVVLRRGLIADGSFEPGAISQRAMERESLVSMVKTALFPGRGEFDAVLPDLPAVVVAPIGPNGVVILGGWSERCFTRSDEIWLKGWIERLRTTLEQSSSLSLDSLSST
ncbi:cofactor assembly of complex C subunit B [Parasynechococcus sp.]|uniref:cofactor assembly of complex C subunit B n=1 Tax=Parasynechococcus sp. TaxID=3101203 RepID=UPI0037040A23